MFTRSTIAVLLAAIAVPAQAQTEPRTETVDISDLNLASEKGVQSLDRRINAAVKRVCGHTKPSNYKEERDMRKCRTDTLARAKPSRNTAIATARDGRLEVASLEIVN